MALTLVFPRHAGRPKSDPQTVKILSSGVARLSPDLCISEYFTVWVNEKKKEIVLKKATKLMSPGVWKMWYSSPSAKSGLISVIGILHQLKMKIEDVQGEYVGKVRNDSEVVIKMRDKKKEKRI